MSMISIPVPQETENQIRQMFEGIAREAIQHAAENEMNSKDFMNYKETAAYLGISYGTLRRWIDEEDLPQIKISGMKLISKDSLKKWLHSREESQ